MTVTIYHDPDCATSRNVLALIRSSGEHYLGRSPESTSLFSALDTWAELRKSLNSQGNYSFLPR